MTIPNYNFILLDETGSTNDYAKTLGELPGDALTVIRAVRQRGGRGRGDKSFFSDHPGGLWVSLIVPVSDMSAHFEHNRAISLAILSSLKNIHKGTGANINTDIRTDTPPLSIKWPNDVYWGDRKVSGILLENIPQSQNALIIGLGVNVNMAREDFPDDLRASATSILIETGREYPLDKLMDDILDRYQQYINADQTAVHQLYSDNLYKKGCRAIINNHTGIFADVGDDGRLCMNVDNKGKMLFTTGILCWC